MEKRVKFRRLFVARRFSRRISGFGFREVPRDCTRRRTVAQLRNPTFATLVWQAFP